jgi:hypothetical protein
MPLTFLLLQLTNALLAAATLWIRFKDPFLWDDQAILISTGAGLLGGSLTAIILGLSLVFRSEFKRGAALLNFVLALAFSVLQGYYFFVAGRDLGVLQLLKSKLG